MKCEEFWFESCMVDMKAKLVPKGMIEQVSIIAIIVKFILLKDKLIEEKGRNVPSARKSCLLRQL